MRQLLIAFTCIVMIGLGSSPAICQQGDQKQQPGQEKTQAQKKSPQIETPAARLASAKNVLIVRTRGGDIPYDTIRTTIEGWGRFNLVNAADKADLVIEIGSTGGDSDVRVSSGMSPSPETGRMESSTRSSKDLSATEVTMTVADARNKRVLWRGTESAKYAMRQKARENNLVEAAEKLASKFHDRLEPPLAK
jgi:hypothetical protein